jgi:hypothetical protein
MKTARRKNHSGDWKVKLVGVIGYLLIVIRVWRAWRLNRKGAEVAKGRGGF